jgi:hypothetical protein
VHHRDEREELFDESIYDVAIHLISAGVGAEVPFVGGKGQKSAHSSHGLGSIFFAEGVPN